MERELNVDAAYTAGEIFARLRAGCHANPTALAFPDGTEYTLGDDAQARRPDASVVRMDRLRG
ncbi:MAG: hypothetical protein ABMB14_13630, partial [Myxococcota bacterium]